MSLKKEFNKKKQVCNVTFVLDNSDVKDANKVNLAGDFNGWDIENMPMKKVKSGEFYASLDLKLGKAYEFKYIVDGKNWINEPEADRHVTNEFQSNNSVVVV